MDLVSIGEFARLSRLSPRALRLYDELGLLVPAHVDADSGYRWYGFGQLEQARLVASLRRLDVPLAQITAILGAEPARAAELVGAYWAQVETEHHGRRALARFLVNRFAGRNPEMYDVAVRQIPARRLLTLHRQVTPDEIVPLGRDFMIRRLRDAPRLEGVAGAAFIIFHGEVSADSDGPIEWCRPVPDARADELAEQFPDLTLRTDPAHQEAYVHLPSPQLGEAESTLVMETLAAWTADHGREPTEGIRIIYLRNPAPERTGPLCDFAVPLV
jgi:DNA-binding transcriptional MerR regulator